MKHEMEIIVGKTIDLDEDEYVDCMFERCLFLFSGNRSVTVQKSTLTDCFWKFVGPAGVTIQFLRNFRKAAGEEACEALIQQLLKGLP